MANPSNFEREYRQRYNPISPRLPNGHRYMSRNGHTGPIHHLEAGTFVLWTSTTEQDVIDIVKGYFTPCTYCKDIILDALRARFAEEEARIAKVEEIKRQFKERVDAAAKATASQTRRHFKDCMLDLIAFFSQYTSHDGHCKDDIAVEATKRSQGMALNPDVPRQVPEAQVVWHGPERCTITRLPRLVFPCRTKSLSGRIDVALLSRPSCEELVEKPASLQIENTPEEGDYRADSAQTTPDFKEQVALPDYGFTGRPSTPDGSDTKRQHLATL